MKKILHAAALFLLPATVCRALFRMFGVKSVQIGRHCRVGFSWIASDRVVMADGSRIGHLNYINNTLINLGGG